MSERRDGLQYPFERRPRFVGKRRPLQVKIGDNVLFTSYAGEEFKVAGDQKVLLMREDDILAVIE